MGAPTGPAGTTPWPGYLTGRALIYARLGNHPAAVVDHLFAVEVAPQNDEVRTNYARWPKSGTIYTRSSTATSPSSSIRITPRVT